MKKAKLMLSVLALCAVLATVFAFRGKAIRCWHLYIGDVNQPNGGNACTLLFHAVSITTTETKLVRASTTSLNSECPVTYTTDYSYER